MRAGSVRPRGLAGIAKSMHLNRPKNRSKTCCRVIKHVPKPKERGKKEQKRGSGGQKPRLSRSTRYRRPECGGGVCQPGGWLGCTLYAGSITEGQRGQPSMHTFCPAELPDGVRLVYALFAGCCSAPGVRLVYALFLFPCLLQRCPASICTFWRNKKQI